MLLFMRLIKNSIQNDYSYNKRNNWLIRLEEKINLSWTTGHEEKTLPRKSMQGIAKKLKN